MKVEALKYNFRKFFLRTNNIISRRELVFKIRLVGKSHLENLDLRRVDLRRVDLRGANLKGCNLEGAVLSWSDLEGANLEGACLQINYHERFPLISNWPTYLKGANMSRSNLYKANLTGAILRLANLKEANLENAVLRWADLGGANLAGANLTGADLFGACLEGAFMEGSKLDRANLKGVRLGHTSFNFKDNWEDFLGFTGFMRTLSPHTAAQHKAFIMRMDQVLALDDRNDYYLNEKTLYTDVETELASACLKDVNLDGACIDDIEWISKLKGWQCSGLEDFETKYRVDKINSKSEWDVIYQIRLNTVVK